MRKKEATPPRARADFGARAEYSTLCESRNLWDFVQQGVRGTQIYAAFERFIKYFRRFRLATAAIRLLPWFLLAVSTDTLRYLAVLLAGAVVPPMLIWVLSVIGPAPLRFRRLNARMAGVLAGRTVYVLFPTAGWEFDEGQFWRNNAKDLASRPNSTVLVVSPCNYK